MKYHNRVILLCLQVKNFGSFRLCSLNLLFFFVLPGHPVWPPLLSVLLPPAVIGYLPKPIRHVTAGHMAR